jgi:uncharacterized protein (DUF1330 family)
VAKGYWITWYHSAVDDALHKAYAELAGKAITAFGGRFLARGLPSASYEGGPGHRCVLVEFDSVADAIAAYESPAYQAAITALDASVRREVRIVEGGSAV